MPDTSVRESKERVRTAIKNSGYELNSKKFLINLAPANTRKEGSYYDLAMAVGILKNLGVINDLDLNNYAFIGELSLNGELNKVNGVLPMCIECRDKGIKSVIIPFDNKDEASIIDGIDIYPTKNLRELVEHINCVKTIGKYKVVTDKKIVKKDDVIDFKEINGQKMAKRVLEIVAAGGHNCLMVGSPGCGKTMLAKALETILPELDEEYSLETTKIHSVAGLLNEQIPRIISPPFRMPHHTISKSAFCGGGRNSRPGEISLAHNGVLYLDEIAEFDKCILESLRIPLEDKKITVSRINCMCTYPSKFIFLASMNPCPCGYYGDKKHACTCTENQIFKYINKLSGPILDRIDIHLEVASVEYRDLKNEYYEECSEDIKKRVLAARKIQQERYKEYGIQNNGELKKELIKKFCVLDEKSNNLLETAYEKYAFSVRTIDKILRVARTIADLDGKENIAFEHLAEAIQYKTLNRFNRGVV